MKVLFIYLFFTLGCLQSLYALENSVVSDKAEAILVSYGIHGTFVLYDLHEDNISIYNKERAEQRFLPASTFKILNSLIALETKAIAGKDSIIHWDRKHRFISAWDQDQSLKSAFQNSVVWAYQKLARRIGEARMRKYVHLSNYGNANIAGGIDHFWLDGELRISAIEQIDFLKRLYKNELPFSESSMEQVKEIMIWEQKDKYTLRAKTGWAMRVKNQVGWYVGFVETKDNVYFFALNIAVTSNEEGRLRETIARTILSELTIIMN